MAAGWNCERYGCHFVRPQIFGSCFQGSFRMSLMGVPAPAVPLASLPLVPAQPLLLPGSCRGEHQPRDRC